MILCIETSTSVCSVALFRGTDLLALSESFLAKNHSTLIIPMVEEVMAEAGIRFDQLSAVAVSAGPGSYTGLRIGVSTAKGFCHAHDIPLIAVPTLQAMAQGFVQSTNTNDGLICPLFDARRMEVYCWLGDNSGKEIEPVQALILNEESFKKHLSTHKIYFVGDGAKKTSEVLKNEKAVFLPDVQPSAKWMGSFAHAKYQAGELEDMAYFEPFYLKDSESHLKPQR